MEYKFGDKVRVTSGFYEGMEGEVRSQVGSEYLVRLNGKKPLDWSSEWFKADKLVSLDKKQEHIPFDERLISIEQHGVDISPFEQFWNAMVAGISFLWNTLASYFMAIPGMKTPAPEIALSECGGIVPIGTDDANGNLAVLSSSLSPRLSEEGQCLMEGLMMMANAGITLGSVAQAMEPYTPDEPVEIDYEQPQPMYPELPEMEM